MRVVADVPSMETEAMASRNRDGTSSRSENRVDFHELAHFISSWLFLDD